jgi:hypothetical protein
MQKHTAGLDLASEEHRLAVVGRAPPPASSAYASRGFARLDRVWCGIMYFDYYQHLDKIC